MYIQNRTGRFHTFVGNRLAVIHQEKIPSNWRCINTKINPFDFASRCISANSRIMQKNLDQSLKCFVRTRESVVQTSNLDRWYKIIRQWPRGERVTARTVIAGQQDSDNSTECVKKLIQHYYSWYILKWTVAWILKVQKEVLWRVNIKRLNSSLISQESSDKSVL